MSFKKTYWIHALILFVLVGYGIRRQLELRNYAQNCMSRAAVQSDSRCLYIYNGHVYQKGSRSSPHHGHACGSDVTTVMPSYHISGAVQYLDPNLVGAVCTGATPTPTLTSTPTSTPIFTPTRTPTPTPTIIPGAQMVEFRVKLAGVTGTEAQGANIGVKFVKKDGSVTSLSSPLVLFHVGSGVYKATAVISAPMPAGTQFIVKIKGEKHVSVAFCRQSGQTTPCTDGQYITVPNPLPSSYIFDFTGIALSPGDLPVQDGRVDRADLGKLAPLMSNPNADLTPSDKLMGDVNYDGFINVRDVFLILQTLETRFDQ